MIGPPSRLTSNKRKMMTDKHLDEFIQDCEDAGYTFSDAEELHPEDCKGYCGRRGDEGRAMTAYSFPGYWPDDNPDKLMPWEDWQVVLRGREAGDDLADPDRIDKALAMSGYKLTLTKLDAEDAP